MSAQDSAITSYRDHAHMLAFGAAPKEVMAELCGKATGTSKGKGGSMHLYNRSRNFYGGNGIVGAQVPIGIGIAFAHKYKNDDGVSVTFFGDGAANQGQIYEAFNMAALWKLPVVFILENNHYAMGTSDVRAAAGLNLHTRGDPFGIQTLLADGMDIFDVITKTTEAINHVRSGNGPIIIHADVYRYKGHSMSDPATYRTKEEVSNMRKTRDPIANIKKILMDNFCVTIDELEKLETETMKIIDEAEAYAIESPLPDATELTTNVIL
jgi:pyruvate dehydrogenase E1 component alpha subunit